MNKNINALKARKVIAIFLAAVLILNIGFFAFSLYNITTFWIVILVVFLITLLFFKKDRT
ncbi:MAG: hypothetical protein PHV16_00210 [Candidatus Nanoarchaeia archaeon]|nr:hypothetical protein [Candidatus Nanoarchaeia archaeon]